MKIRILSLLFAAALVMGCSLFEEEASAKTPAYLPVIQSPSSAIPRALVPDFSNPNKEIDFFVPAITSFKQNKEGVSVDDVYSVSWGNIVLAFTISEENGIYTFAASKDEDYKFELVFDENKSSFHYYHEINIDQRSTDATQTNVIVKSVISETTVNSDGAFKGQAKLAGYALGGAGSYAETPGVFLLYDNIEIYNGLINAVQSQDMVINTTEQNGYGFAYYKMYMLDASTEYSLNLNNAELFTALDGMISSSASFKTNSSTVSMIQASIAVKLDDNTSFFETDAGWTSHVNHLWTTEHPAFATFKALIPWTSDLAEN